MTIWFSSDLHLSHSKVISHAKRPFKDIEEMNEALIKNWNDSVSEKDIGYILGDFSFAKGEETARFIRRMNGAQIHLILGNHDAKMKDWVKKEFDSVQHYLEIKIPDETLEHGKQFVVLCHFPFLTFNKCHHGAWNLHGHCHGTLKNNKGKRLDVGVDCFDYKPVSYEQIKEIMKSKEFVAEDRHGEHNETRDEE